MKNKLVEMRHVYKRYTGGQQQENTVLKDINLTVKEGEFISIMGASGSGKSTLLYAMSGLDQVSEGSVLIQGEALEKLSEKQLAAFRLSHMGFVFQQIYLLKNLNVYDNILLPAAQEKKHKLETLCRRVDELMHQTGIYELKDRSISAISGGQLQRAGICRALVNQPKLLFADEPTGALNSKSSKEIMDIFNSLHEQGTGIVLVTHDIKVSARAERVIFMKDGEVQGDEYLGAYDGCDAERERLLGEKVRMYDL